MQHRAKTVRVAAHETSGGKLLAVWITLQDRTWPSWASNDDPLKDLSNTRALKHLEPLATDYWAASHRFVEPGHSCFRSKFEKIRLVIDSKISR